MRDTSRFGAYAGGNVAVAEPVLPANVVIFPRAGQPSNAGPEDLAVTPSARLAGDNEVPLQDAVAGLMRHLEDTLGLIRSLKTGTDATT